MQAALDHSIPIKRTEAGLKSLLLWGRIRATNGRVRVHALPHTYRCPVMQCGSHPIQPPFPTPLQDYLVAEGHNDPLFKDGRVHWDAKYYFSQDGVKWADLVAIDSPTASKADKVKALLSGDPSKVFELEEKDPQAAAAVAASAAEGEAAGGEEGPKPIIIQVPELALLRHRIDSINAATGVVPVVRVLLLPARVVLPSYRSPQRDVPQGVSNTHPQNALLPDAHNRVVANRLFTGVAYPEKLESYTHRTASPEGPTLAQDLRGAWSLHYDPFKKVATCRNLVWPGYAFYYNAHDLTWGAAYLGDGLRNDDLIFML